MAPRSRRPFVVPAPLAVVHRRRYGILSGLLAGIPLLRAVALERARGWVPAGDEAVVAVRSIDVFSRHSPLIGQASMAADDASVHAPGPALYWLLALPARIGAHWWQPALVGLLAVAVFVAICVIVDDLAGRFAAVTTGIVLVLVVRSVDASKLVQPINPYVGLVLLVATWFLAWRVATGRPRTYPLLIAAASLTAQMHLAYAVPVALTVVVASADLLLPVLIARRRDPAPSPTPPWRWVLAGAGTGLLLWAAPTWEQLTSRPGNLGAILTASGNGTARQGLRPLGGILAHVVGWPPRFLTREILDPLPRWIQPPSATRSATALLLVLVAVLVLVDAVRRRDRIAVAGQAIGFAALASVGAGYAIMPAEGPGSLTLFYTMRWMVPAGALFWLVTGIGVGRAILHHRRIRSATDPETGELDEPTGARLRLLRSALPPVLVLALTGLIGWFTVIPVEYESWSDRPARVLGDAAVTRIESGGLYRLEGPLTREVLELVPALTYRIRREGAAVVMGPTMHRWVDPLGSSYGRTGRPCDGRFDLRPVDPDRPASDDPTRGERTGADRANTDAPADASVLVTVDTGRSHRDTAPSLELVFEDGDPDRSC